MKQFTPIVMLLLATATGAFAQSTEQLPNAGFETWVQRSLQTHEEPSGWYSLNFLKKYGYPSTTSKTTDAHSGTYAVLLESKAGAFSDIPGLLCSNYMFDSLDNPDFNLNLVPFHSRPLSISFWYKSDTVPGDTIAFQMQLYRWNTSTGKRDTIGEANMVFLQYAGSYNYANCTFSYTSMAVPDSASVIFSTTVYPFSPAIGAKLYLDDLQLNYPATGTGVSPTGSAFAAYPNPVSQQLYVVVPEDEPVTSAEMLDMHGQRVRQQQLPGRTFSFDCADLCPGVYLLHLHLASGQVRTTRITR